MNESALIWGPLRATLQDNFSFAKIKQIVGLAGLDLTSISQYEQAAHGRASLGQLMTGVDLAYGALNSESR